LYSLPADLHSPFSQLSWASSIVGVGMVAERGREREREREKEKEEAGTPK
jgi:hypothetical protein